MTFIVCSTKRPCEHLYCRVLHGATTASGFLREFLRAPGAVGSVCPSSSHLTHAMMDLSHISEGGLVIDLGAGSGAVSRQLLAAGVSPKRILALEVSSGFTESFRRQCPDLPLRIGDARYLSSLLQRHAPGMKVSSIISSLPFRVMSSRLVKEILEEIRMVAAVHDARLVQYSYAWWMRYPLREYGFMPVSSRLVALNVPPARVEVYTTMN